MYHRWVWPLVAIVTAFIIITVDGFTEQTAVRVYFLIGVFGIAITAFCCLVSWPYRPMLTSPQEGAHDSPGEGPMRVSITVRGETAAKPQGKAAKEAFDVRMWEAYQFACSVLTMRAHEPGSVPKMQAERELLLAKFQHVRLENEQLREKVERLLPELTRAVEKAGSVIRATKPPAATPIPERRPKKQPKQDKPVHVFPSAGTRGTYVEDGACDTCGKENRRRVRVYGVRRGKKGEDAVPHDLDVCRGGCELTLTRMGNGSLTPPDTESGSIQSEAVPETAVAS